MTIRASGWSSGVSLGLRFQKAIPATAAPVNKQASAPTSARRKRVLGRTAEVTRSVGAGAASDSSISMRASPMSRSRRCASFCRQRRSRSRIFDGVRFRQRAPVRLVLQDRREDVRQCLACERRAAGQHLVAHAAERPDVGAFVHRQAASLLGAHVRRRAENSSFFAERGGLREVLAAIAGEGFCQSKIQHLYAAFGRHLHVGRLQIAMDHAFFVRRFQRLRDLSGNLQRLLDRQRAFGNALGQRLARNQFHHQIIHAAGLLEAMDRRDVGMIQCRQHARFALKAGQPLGIVRKARGKDLDGDLTPQLDVARFIDFAHAARAQQGNHLVAAHLTAQSIVGLVLR